ncbi:MAG: DUF4340 domain-containing protein [Phycisphaerales bacterium]
MSLRSLLISIIVAGLFAGLVLISQSVRSSQSAQATPSVRTIGIDASGITLVSIKRSEQRTQQALRTDGTGDKWNLILDENAQEWPAHTPSVRTALRAISTASVAVDSNEPIGDLYGTLILKDQEAVSTEIHFGNTSAGGFVRGEVVERGDDGIATNRWFGRFERSLRDSIFIGGLEQWRSTDLFPFTPSQVKSASIRSGNESTDLSKVNSRWMVVNWNLPADVSTVQNTLGLTLGLSAERFYDQQVYTDDLTGLENPIARIRLSKQTPQSSPSSVDESQGIILEIGSAIDSTGAEVFARYRDGNNTPVVIALSTQALNRLTAAPLAYVRKTVVSSQRSDLVALTINDTENTTRLKARTNVDQWIKKRDDSEVALTPSEANAVERLFAVLSAQDASQIMVNSDAKFPSRGLVGSVEILNRSNRVERYQLAVVTESTGLKLHICSEFDDPDSIVWIMDSDDAAGTGAWIASLSVRPIYADDEPTN